MDWKLGKFFLCFLIELGMSKYLYAQSTKSFSQQRGKFSTFEFQSELLSKWAVHTEGDHRLSTNKYELTLSQTFHSGDFYVMLSGKGLADGGPSQNSNYTDSFARRQASEFQIRDNYIQYKNDRWNLKFGYQQVVWGETIGAFYADIVNAKDFRDLAPDEVQGIRIPSLIALGELLFSEGTIQIIFSPQPKFNQIGDPSGDFSFVHALSKSLGAEISIDSEDGNFQGKNVSETGLRFSKLVKSTDLSLFYFNYFDRSATYSSKISSLLPLKLILTPEHQKIMTYGFTLTQDLELMLIRIEVLFSPTKYQIGVLNNEFKTVRADQSVFVLEVGFSQLEIFRLTAQISTDRVSVRDQEGLTGDLKTLRHKNLNFMSIGIGKTIGNDLKLDFYLTQVEHDKSSLVRGKVSIPVNTRLELNFGYDGFSGDQFSYWGQYQYVSRFWTGIHGYF